MADPNSQSSDPQSSDPPDAPCGCGDDQPISPGRRSFLARIGVGLGAAAAALAGLPVIGFLFSPVKRDERDVWRSVGRVEDFPVGDTVLVSYLEPEPLPWAGYAARNGAYIRRETEEAFVAFSIYCTHTACPLTWSEGAQLFMCPCHGGTFHRDGRVAAGPPPRPLDRFDVRVRDGLIEIRTVGLPLTD